MPLIDAVKLKMTQAADAAALLDGIADYDETKILGFFVKGLGVGGKTYDFQINPTDAMFAGLLADFTALLASKRDDAQAILKDAGVI